MTKVTRLDDFTEVDMAEGRLLNEIHEHISLGISQALTALVAAVREEGIDALAKANADGFAEGVEFTTSELAVALPAENELPTVYGDALPIKET